MSNEIQTLVRLNAVRQELTRCTNLSDLKRIRDTASALHAYTKAQGLSADLQWKAGSIRVDAEARIGELLRERVPDEGARGHGPGRGKKAVGPPTAFSTEERKRFRAVARVPEEQREKLKATLGADVSPTGVVRLARGQQKRDKADAVRTALVEGPDVVKGLAELIECGAKYSTVYADPPWAYLNQSTRAATNGHYVTMTPDEIAAMPVRDVLTDDAHLHLWTTNAFLFEAKAVIEAWGFEYRSCFVWVKPQMGIGNYWRVSHEFLLLGVRGDSLKFKDKTLMSWAEIPRTEHSSKPEVVRSMVERASPGPYLELFGRMGVEGWTVMGNEVGPTQRRLVGTIE